MNSVIWIDTVENYHILSGNIESILKNRMLKFSLKNLNSFSKKDNIKIPFEEKTKILVLQKIQSLLKKFNFKIELGETTKKEESAFIREEENFKIFSDQAKKIRNNEFSNNPILIERFKLFKTVLETKMKRKLYRLQMLSAFHLAFSQNACNFSVPGSGKTSIVYAAYCYLKNLPEDDKNRVNKILIVGPISSFAPWENEYEKCFGKKIKSQRLSLISKSEKQRILNSTTTEELILISHAGLKNLEKEIVNFQKKEKVMIVMDEAHRVKNPDGEWGKSSIEVAKEAVSRVVLTGTPIPNGYEDLYNLIRFIYPFKYQDILQIHYPQLKDLKKNNLLINEVRVKKFTKRIEPYFVRIKKEDLKLPPIEEKVITVSMDEKQRTIYDFIEKKYLSFFRRNSAGTIKDILNKAKLIRLRQAATNPALLLKTLEESLKDSGYDDESHSLFTNKYKEKFEDYEIFKEIKNYSKTNIPLKFVEIKKLIEKEIVLKNEKFIIWTIFVQNAEELKTYLKKNKIKSKLLIGRVPQFEREDIVKKFNDPKNFDFQIVIANPFSVSESISIHEGCHNAIYMERDYNAGNFLQSKDRIHRYGLAKNIITKYYYIVSDKSIDSVINEKINIKIKRMEKIINNEIPLFKRVDNDDETDLIIGLIKDYEQRT